MKAFKIGLITIFSVIAVSANSIINVPTDQSTIQAGIDAANEGDTVLVHTGSYVENINYHGKNIVVGSLFITTGDTSYISRTVIDGNQNGSVVTFDNEEDHAAVLSGFTVTNGHAEGGGGIICRNNSDPTLADLIISGNSGTKGAGIHCWNSSPDIVNVTMRGNSQSGFTFASGGGIFCGANSSPTIKNVLITGHKFSQGGGVSCYENSNPILENVTITGNQTYNAGAILCWDNSTPKVINSILWNNQPNQIAYVGWDGEPSSIEISYSIVQGGQDTIRTSRNGNVQWLDGNLNSNPLFVDAENGDFHLQKDSPCINAGNPDPQYNDLNGSRNDMGIYGGSKGVLHSIQKEKAPQPEEPLTKTTKEEKPSFWKKLFKKKN